MNNAAATAALLSDDEATLIDVNDWAVNVVREFAAEKGYNAAALVAEESARIDDADLTLAEYIAVRRIGSRFRLSRVVRRAVFVAIRSREILTTGL